MGSVKEATVRAAALRDQLLPVQWRWREAATSPMEVEGTRPKSKPCPSKAAPHKTMQKDMVVAGLGPRSATASSSRDSTPGPKPQSGPPPKNRDCTCGPKQPSGPPPKNRDSTWGQKRPSGPPPQKNIQPPQKEKNAEGGKKDDGDDSEDDYALVSASHKPPSCTASAEHAPLMHSSYKRASHAALSRPAPPAKTAASVPKTGPAPTTSYQMRGAWARGGQDNYVNVEWLPDPLNKNTDAWWEEVEKGPSRIQKSIDDCKLWWPTAEDSAEGIALLQAISELKRFHRQDFYRGTPQEKELFEEAIYKYFSSRQKFQKASKEEAQRKAEEEANRKAEEEDAKRKAEEKGTNRKAEEDDVKRKAEEEGTKRKAEEEEAKRKAEEKGIKRKAEEEEAKRKAEEEANRKAEEEDAKRKPEEKGTKWKAEEEEAKRKAEEKGIKRKAEEEEAKRKAEEEATRKTEEEDAETDKGGKGGAKDHGASSSDPANADNAPSSGFGSPPAPKPRPSMEIDGTNEPSYTAGARHSGKNASRSYEEVAAAGRIYQHLVDNKNAEEERQKKAEAQKKAEEAQKKAEEGSGTFYF